MTILDPNMPDRNIGNYYELPSTRPKPPGLPSEQSKTSMTRRGFLGLGGATILAVACGLWAKGREPEEEVAIQSCDNQAGSTAEVSDGGIYLSPLEGIDEFKQEMMRKLGITESALFKPGIKLPEGRKFDGFSDDELLPGVFYNEVLSEENKMDIYKVAEIYKQRYGHDISPNIVAYFMNIESAGNRKANSGQADGAFQLNPNFYENTLDNVALAIRTSFENAYAYRLETEGVMLPDDDVSADTFIRAAMMYNAGVSGAWAEFGELIDYTIEDKYDPRRHQTQLYGMFAKQFILGAQFASEMRRSGHSNKDIAVALQINEVDRRAWALNRYVYPDENDQRPRRLTIIETLECLASGPEAIAAGDEVLKSLYNKYDPSSNDPKDGFTTQFGFPLRLHAAMGGVGHATFGSNANVNKYLEQNTDRPQAAHGI